MKTDTKDKDNKENSYYKKRLKNIGITPEYNKVSVYDKDNPNQLTVKIFEESKEKDKEGIRINYFSPSGMICKYESNKKLKDFFRIRLENRNGKGKYFQPANSGSFPFITPIIIEKFKKQTEIETLFIVEGEFKAFSGYINLDLDIIGIPGIHCYKDKREVDKFIKQVIEKCKIKNIILLFDADALAVEYSIDKDLYHRPNMFYTAVRNFKELLKPFSVDVYFSHISEKHLQTGKGLDDLISLNTTNIKTLKNELLRFTTGNTKREYIKTISISENSICELRKYFCIDSVNNFHNRYFHIIGESEFLYSNKRYKYDPKEQKLKISWYNEANQYVRVGTTYYKISTAINSDQEQEEILQEWEKGILMTDFSDPEFIKQIPKFDLFCNIPENDPEKYKKTHISASGGFKTILYNKYYKINHEIKKGDFLSIDNFLKHIFSQKNLKGESLYEFGLDYIQIMYMKPLQRLPVLCPVSKERNTGKSTFLYLLKAIFKENMVILDNERFSGKFTSHYTGKLVTAIDETFVEVDKKVIEERIKNLCIGESQWLEAKGKNAQEIQNYTKLILVSNNETNFLHIDTGENRYAVFKVPILEKDDPSLLEKMKKEIPFFLYFLKNRKLKYAEGVTRFSFSTDVYMTDKMKAVQEITKSPIEKAISNFIVECFFNLGKVELDFHSMDITEYINKSARFKFSESQVKDFLKYDKNMKNDLKKYKKYHNLFPSDEIVDREAHSTVTSRVYNFKYTEWMNDEDIEKFHKHINK